MRRLKSLIVEVHRRSMWQVLAVYVGASWFVLQAAEHVVQRYLLPEWVYPAALLLLLIGLPIVLATAMVREEPLPRVRTGGGADDAGAGTKPARAPSDPPARLSGEPPRPWTDGPAAATPGAEPGPGSAPPHGAVPDFAATLRSSPIAWLLTWRRALAGGALAFAVLAVLAAFVVARGAPRIAEAQGSAAEALAERGWVVVADFDAVDEDDAVALAAREALTVDLQQSGHANVYPRAQVVNVLRRIGVPDTARLDLELALDVAQRVGAGAVLAATVSRLGAHYHLSARALRPETREELFSVRAAAGRDRLLDGVEALSREVRRRFGERRDEIRRSRPLPEVTTASLEALKIYAEAAELQGRGGSAERAGALAAEAIRLDSTFAAAYRLAAVTAFNQARIAESGRHIARAYELRDRLTDRERWHVEALYHERVLDPRRAAATYELILARYPEDATAANDLGTILVIWLGDFEGAYRTFARSSELDPYSVISITNALFVAEFVGEAAAADSLARAADERGFDWLMPRSRAGRAFATGRAREASALCDTILAGPPRFVTLTDDREFCGSIDVARGRVRHGLSRLEQVERVYAAQASHLKLTDVVLAAAAAEAVRGDTAAAAARIAAFVGRVGVETIPEPDRTLARTQLAIMAALLGRPDLADDVEAALPAYPDPDHWLARIGEALVRAARAIAAGDGEAALGALRDRAAIEQKPAHVVTFSEFLLPALAHDAADHVDAAIDRYTELAAPNRLSPPFTVLPRILLPFVLRRLAELEESRGNHDAAAAHYARLIDLWDDTDPELRGQVESVRRALRRLEGADR